MRILHKIFMIILIPFLSIAFFLGDLSLTKLDNLNQIKKSVELSLLSKELLSIINAVQSERKFSVDFIDSKGITSKIELKTAIANTTIQVIKFNDFLKNVDQQKLDSEDKELETNINNINANIKSLDKLRNSVMSLNTNSDKVISAYYSFNDSVLEAVEYLSSIDNNSELAAMRLAYMKILSAQEKSSLQMSILKDVAFENSISKNEYSNLISAFDAEKKDIKSYMIFANNEQEEFYKAKLKENVSPESDNLVNMVASKSETDKFYLSPQKLEQFSNSKTILFEKVIEKISEDINKKTALLMKNEYLNLTLFGAFSLLILVISGIALFIITRSITRPLNQAVRVSQKLSEGDLDVTINSVSKDETGILLNSMKEMVAYIREIANIAQRIAQGDIRVNVNPRSEKDVLNNSFLETIHYIQEVAGIAEKISKKDLRVNVKPKSENDVLNNALYIMVNNLQDTIGKLSESVSIISSTSEQLASTSMEISSSAEEQSLATQHTSTTLLQMAGSIEIIEKNTYSLFNNVEETSVAIDQMSKSVNSVAISTEDLTSLANNSLFTISEMASSIEEVSVNTVKVTQASENVVKEAKEGERVIMTTINNTRQLAAMMINIEEVIKALNKSNQEINSIVDVINDIADQTNLLALNAAIEASRAGEHGRGFAVVAAEVRKLAERSSVSIKQIVKIIDSIQQEGEKAITVANKGSGIAHEGEKFALQASQTLDRLIHTINDTNTMMHEIRKATEEQSVSSNIVVSNVERMVDKVLQVNDSTREQAQSGQQIKENSLTINKMAGSLNTSVTEQRSGSEQIVKAINNIAVAATQNIYSSNQIVNVAENLKDQARELEGFVDSFKINETKQLILKA